MASPGPRQKTSKAQSKEPTQPTSSNTKPQVTYDVLLHFLYGKKTNEPVDLIKLQKKRHAERLKTYCDVCRVDRPPNGCQFHKPSTTADQEDRGLSYAIKSFPPEVQLCTSSIPGARYGVCAKRVIPEGTWIGPYEGKRVKPEDLVSTEDNPYIWEIYEGSQASCYIDGSDENQSSWMRFIRCARNKNEQNLFSFQYLDNVFYRSFKEISPGIEMLVWYDDKYPQHLGIPTGLQQIEFVNVLEAQQNSTSTQLTVQQGKHHQQKPDGNLGNVKVQTVRPSLQQTPTSVDSLTMALSSDNPFPNNYPRPWGPLDGPSLLPASAYGRSNNTVPVNISAGIPSTRRMPGRVHTGITGPHEQEGTAIGTVYARLALPDNHGNNKMTPSSISTNTEWISSSTDAEALAHVPIRPSSNPLSSQSYMDSGVRVSSCPNVTVVSSNNEVRISNEEERSRLQYLPYSEEVTEEVLRERGYTVDSPRTRSMTKRQSPPALGGYIWRDEDDIIDKKQRLSNEHEDLKSSDSYNSNTSCKEIGSALDEISMWRCRQCHKTFTQRVQLQVHVCPNEPFKPYRCGQCELSFDTAPELRSHVDSHASEKPFKCGFCSRSFAGATTLNNHIRTHMGKRPFSCECGKSFAQAAQLARHQRTPGECEDIAAEKQNNS